MRRYNDTEFGGTYYYDNKYETVYFYEHILRSYVYLCRYAEAGISGDITENEREERAQRYFDEEWLEAALTRAREKCKTKH